ncbi:winged helix-turn-helix transcriptional regulator [Bradyrhizobium iriomotense]|uniref:winged helix-turn-helix transcriptional regulator n=1 Tax=Bradyrhizobium iriomotense TaxID=441950 RepID=UPI001B8A12CD|nr:helix-turn-helix transcriptional regulator [Bradyrhizobium iriomotense]
MGYELHPPCAESKSVRYGIMKRGKGASHFDPIYRTGELLGDAWSWMILREAIFDGATRFGEFQERLAISPKVLTARLGMLSEGGLFERHMLEGRGAPVEYRLTDMGRDFASCLLSAMRWGLRWQETKARSRHRTVVSHERCGHPFVAEFRCSHCREPVRSRDVGVVSMHRASADLIGHKRQRMPDLDVIDRSGTCPIAYTLRVIGDRWSSLVIRECFLGTKRFSEFEEHLGIATNILSNRLERLVHLGVLIASPISDQRTRFAYRLTEKGHDLYGVPLALLTWGERWLARGESLTKLVHKPCGHRLRALFCCGSCGAPASFDDLAFRAR